MKNISDHNEHLLKATVLNDNPAIRPSKAIEERLNYYYSIKQPQRKLHMNSFAGMFFWLFSMKGLGLKASLVSVSLAYFLFFGNIKNGPDERIYSDSCQVRTLVADTNFTVKDTCKKLR